jgi:hypothetical protein
MSTTLFRLQTGLWLVEYTIVLGFLVSLRERKGRLRAVQVVFVISSDLQRNCKEDTQIFWGIVFLYTFLIRLSFYVTSFPGIYFFSVKRCEQRQILVIWNRVDCVGWKAHGTIIIMGFSSPRNIYISWRWCGNLYVRRYLAFVLPTISNANMAIGRSPVVGVTLVEHYCRKEVPLMAIISVVQVSDTPPALASPLGLCQQPESFCRWGWLL